MSDAKNCKCGLPGGVCERCVVERERKAYVEGRRDGHRANGGDPAKVDYLRRECWEKTASRDYPLPKVTRTREVADPEVWGIVWRYNEGSLGYKGLDTNGWWVYLTTSYTGPWKPTPARVRVWADLIATPTEEVDA